MQHVFACGYSRSGTTLLTTILDSHPGIAMGYELMPLGLPPLGAAIEAIERAAAQGDPAEILRTAEATRSLGVFLIHCSRARVGADEALEVLRSLHDDGMRRIRGLRDRLRVATAIVERKRAKENATLSGFKANTPRVGAVERVLPGSAYVFIVRDPRDVLASQLDRGFDRPVRTVARHWTTYVARFRRFAHRHPQRAALIRYEDLVADRDDGLRAIFGAVGLDYGDEVVRFYDSNASIHGTRHNNAPNVGRDLYETSVGRWREELSAEQVEGIVRRCRRHMAALGYEP
jgi:hypothetical protein